MKRQPFRLRRRGDADFTLRRSDRDEEARVLEAVDEAVNEELRRARGEIMRRVAGLLDMPELPTNRSSTILIDPTLLDGKHPSILNLRAARRRRRRRPQEDPSDP